MARPKRIMVVGTSGAGKSTLARKLGAALDLKVVELDAINWQRNWRDLNTDDPELFMARVAEAISGEHWVSDGNYGLVRPLILARVTDIVWLDYSRPLVMSRVVRRSFIRAFSGRELWPGTGNVETMRRWLSPDHPIRWAWSTHAVRRQHYAELVSELPAHVAVHHLRRPSEAETLIERLAPPLTPLQSGRRL